MIRREDNLRDDETAEEAARWFARLQDEGASGEDWLAFESWLVASPAHSAAYERLEGVWEALDELAPELARVLAREPARRSVERRRRRAAPMTRRRWLAGGAAIAAGLAAAVALRPRLEPRTPSAASVVYDAGLGQIRDLRLEDGTRVRLNAGSRVTVRFDRDARRVVMADGEAAFDVAHDPARPFLIQVGDRQLRVVGTEFDLRRREGKIMLTVRRGLVEVRPAGAAGTPAVRVAPGQQFTHVEATGASQLSAVDAGDAFAWTEGRLVCRDQPLSEIAAELSRRFARPIRVADPETGEIRFSGVLMLDDAPAVLDRLAALAPLQVLRGADGSYTLRRHG